MWNHKIYDQKEYSVPFLILGTTVIVIKCSLGKLPDWIIVSISHTFLTF